MIHEIKVPSAGESVTEAYIGEWRKNAGDVVQKGEILVELESQKASFELESEFSGRLEILAPEPETTVTVGEVIARIDDSVSAGDAPAAAPSSAESTPTASASGKAGPAVRKLMKEQGVDAATITGSGQGGRILKEDVLQRPASSPAPTAAPTPAPSAPATSSAPQMSVPVFPERGDRVVKATRIRQQIAKNLVQAKNTAAILTTFNEVDMTSVLSFRKRYKESFKEKYGTSLGMMGFFALASVKALQEFPESNAYFDGKNVVYHDYVDISVAVSTDRGLVVPVIKDVQNMNNLDFEKALLDVSLRARDGKLSIDEMTGGTFTISNGGVFGSMLSTPILNMPQTAILGLHNIIKRPVAINDEVVIRPMMYLALSYDHRIIDGRQAVLTLVKMKECLENLDLIVDSSLFESL